MDLVKIEEKNVKEIFTVEGIEGLIDQVRLGVKDFEPDLSTVKSRKDIASMAYKVAQSKTYVEGFGKKLSTALKADAKAVDAARKHCRDTLDGIRDEIRQPLNDWEAEEDHRVSAHQAAIEYMKQWGNLRDINGETYNSATLKHSLKTLETIQLGEKIWDEFADEATKIKKECCAVLRVRIKSQEKYEAEQLELERLRKKAAEQEQKEHEARIAKEAAKQAKKEAEEKAEYIRLESERREREAKETIERVEREKVEAVERAKFEKELAVKEAEHKAKKEAAFKDTQRLEKEEDERAQSKRIASNKQHRQKIESEIIEDLEMAGYEMIYIKSLIELINTNAVRHIIIQY